MRNRGFTLIELMVVLAIVTVLIALLAPALHHAVDDARRIACVNNLKQIGTAMHHYHDTYSTFPPGWVAQDGYPGNGLEYGWGARLLPFHLDQEELAGKLDIRGRPDAKNALLQTKIPVFLCPTDTTPDLNPLRGNFATSNYSGSYGDQPFPRWAPLGQSDAWPGSMDAPMKSTGVFCRNSKVKVQDITDGLENTIFLGEKSSRGGGSVWFGVTDNAHEDDTLSDLSHGSTPNAGPNAFSSRHSAIVNVGMASGTVRSINVAINSTSAPYKGVWQLLGNKADGMVMPNY